MMKLIRKVFTRANLESYIYTALILGSLVLMSLTSCSTIEPIEGLCYNDRDGTYLCPKEEKETDMEELQPLYDYCEQFETHGGEVWMQCIMNEDARRKLLIERLA